MTWSPDLTTTGAAVASYLTSPTYTYVSVGSSDPMAREYAVTTLGGTQTNVRTATAGDPFGLRLKKDATYKVLPPKNPVNGAYGNVPLNKTEFLFRKGLKIDSSGTIRPGYIRISYEIPAGAESNDAVNIAALHSFAVGTLVEESDDVVGSVVTGVL